MSDVEFDEPGRDSGPEELEAGPDRRRRFPDAVWIGVAGAVVVIALVVDLLHGHGSNRPSPAPSSEASTSSGPTQTTSSLLQQQLSVLALDSDPVTGTVTYPSMICPDRPGKVSPSPAQRAAITRWFPQFVQLEARAETDGARGLCAVTIRSHDTLGSILIIRVVAPPTPPKSEFDVTNYGGTGIYPNFIGADYVSPNQFHVQIGLLLSRREDVTAGSPTAQLAEDAGLTW